MADLSKRFGTQVKVVSDDYTVTAADSIIVASGTKTITLPAGTTNTLFTVKNAGTGTITVDAHSNQTIDGAANVSLDDQYDAVTVVWNGTEWSILWTTPAPAAP